jgi:hypothetical protein
METGNWKLGLVDFNPKFQVSSFEFPVSKYEIR